MNRNWKICRYLFQFKGNTRIIQKNSFNNNNDFIMIVTSSDSLLFCALHIIISKVIYGLYHANRVTFVGVGCIVSYVWYQKWYRMFSEASPVNWQYLVASLDVNATAVATAAAWKRWKPSQHFIITRNDFFNYRMKEWSNRQETIQIKWIRSLYLNVFVCEWVRSQNEFFFSLESNAIQHICVMLSSFSLSFNPCSHFFSTNTWNGNEREREWQKGFYSKSIRDKHFVRMHRYPVIVTLFF